MDFHRIWVVIKKDMAWIKGDFKLLGTVSIIPAFMILMFSTVSRRMNIMEGINLDASMGIDINVMGILLLICTTGCITTSHLILQEKAKGTLLALLITPLKHQEFILGKLFFTFTLSLLFAVILVLASGMKDLIQPIVILNMALFTGTVCFIGCVVGIFSETELENNAIIFIALVFFTSAFILKTIGSPGLQIFYFIHPTSHFFEIFSVNGFQNLLIHTGFNFLFFVGFFLFSVLYIRFYFSNNKEKRFSFPLFFSLCAGFIGLFILSVLLFLTGQYDTDRAPDNQTTKSFQTSRRLG